MCAALSGAFTIKCTVLEQLERHDPHDERCVPGFDPHAEGCRAHCRAVRKCVLNAPCEKERCTVVRASKVYHPMALKTCVE